jgi:TolB protein
MEPAVSNTRAWSPLAGLLLVVILCTLPARLQGQSKALVLGFQLTHSVIADPTLSPDGSRMVFISVILGREQLFAMNLDGSDQVQLTHDDADHEDPAWSPDGKTIAFVLSKDEVERIYLMDADGSRVRPLTPAGTRTIHPSWSPDGLRVAYCTDDDLKPPYKNPAQIYSIEVSSGRITRLISGGVNTYPVWSPDGKKIAFRRMLGEMNSEVFLANSDGSGARNLTNHPAFDGWPAWSPDGSRMAFASNRNANYQIFVMNPDGTEVRLVANTEGRATAPKWGKDGKALYFTVCKKVDFGRDCQIFAAKLEESGRASAILHGHPPSDAESGRQHHTLRYQTETLTSGRSNGRPSRVLVSEPGISIMYARD